MYIRWYAENMWLFVPVQQKIKEFVANFHEYPYQLGRQPERLRHRLQDDHAAGRHEAAGRSRNASDAAQLTTALAGSDRWAPRARPHAVVGWGTGSWTGVSPEVSPRGVPHVVAARSRREDPLPPNPLPSPTHGGGAGGRGSFDDANLCGAPIPNSGQADAQISSYTAFAASCVGSDIVDPTHGRICATRATVLRRGSGPRPAGNSVMASERMPYGPAAFHPRRSPPGVCIRLLLV